MTKLFKLFALGSNGSGQLGIGHRDDTEIPQICIFEKEDIESLNEDDCVLKIVAGGNHTLVLLKSGAVFAAGSNEAEQFYLRSPLAKTNVFQRVIIPEWHDPARTSDNAKFVDISATWEASFLLDTKGRVLSFGTGTKGELGRGNLLTATSDLQDPPSGALFGDELKVRSLYSGMRHTVAITDDGGVYGWGSCRKGELGEDVVHRKEIWSPYKLSVPFKCQKAITGRNFTVLFGSSDCKVLGRDQALQGITGLKDLPLYAVESGWSTAYALVNKRVNAFGRNDRGQWPSDELPGLLTFAAGSEHCLGLTSTNQVVAWGWGEHGNCGQPTDHRGNVADRWNTLVVPLECDEVIVNVAAGCATSFMVIKRSFNNA